MATRIHHGTTVGGTVLTVTLSREWDAYEIVNRGTSDLFISTDGVTQPTVLGDDFAIIMAGTADTLKDTETRLHPDAADLEGGVAAPSTTVLLISSAATAFTVTGK